MMTTENTHVPLLGVNIDHVATVRNARGVAYPDPIQAALLAEKAGADGITIHLREDRRHIRDDDVLMLKDVLQTRMNLEFAATEEMIAFVTSVGPAHACVVPERREELTTEGGLDVQGHLSALKDCCRHLMNQGIDVSLFIDPDPVQIDASLACGVKTIELHTGRYAETHAEEDCAHLRKMVRYAHEAGLVVNAGHGLHYQNASSVARIPNIHELNIGHAIVARAIFVGISQAVREMKALLAGHEGGCDGFDHRD